jgi:hypothetical protein
LQAGNAVDGAAYRVAREAAGTARAGSPAEWRADGVLGGLWIAGLRGGLSTAVTATQAMTAGAIGLALVKGAGWRAPPTGADPR